jgi:hypothetical protein
MRADNTLVPVYLAAMRSIGATELLAAQMQRLVAQGRAASRAEPKIAWGVLLGDLLAAALARDPDTGEIVNEVLFRDGSPWRLTRLDD